MQSFFLQLLDAHFLGSIHIDECSCFIVIGSYIIYAVFQLMCKFGHNFRIDLALYQP